MHISLLIFFIIIMMFHQGFAAVPEPQPLPSFRLPPVIQQQELQLESQDLKLTKAEPAVEKLTLAARIVDGIKIAITFPWLKKTSHVIYQRYGRIYIAFDQIAAFDVETVTKLHSVFYDDFKQEPSQQGLTLVSFKMPKKRSMKMERQGQSWVLWFSNDDSSQPTSAVMKPHYNDNPVAHLDYVVQGVRSIGIINDPIGHDKVHVVFTDMPQATQGINAVDYTLLSTHAGIAVVPKSDDLNVTLYEQGFSIGRHGNKSLHLSSTADYTSTRKPALPVQLLDFSPWEHPQSDWFTINQHHLFKIAHTKGRERIEARLQSIGFLLSTGYFYEASAQAQLLTVDDSELIDDLRCVLLQAMGHVLTYQPDRAQKLFDHPQHGIEPEMLLWKGIGQILQEHYKQGLHTVIQNMRYLRHYPKAVRNFICMLAAQASYELDYPGKIFLDFISKVELTPYEQALYDLYAYELDHEARHADKEHWQLKKLLTSRHRRVRSEATLLLANPSSANAEVTIKNLESVRFAWRGDDTELALWRHLAKLYEHTGKTNEALMNLRQIHEYAKSTADQSEALRQGQDLLHQAFVKPNETLVKPAEDYKTIALYHEFKEFIPTDERREQIFDRLLTIFEQHNQLQAASDCLEKNLTHAYKNEDIKGRHVIYLASLYLEQHHYKKVTKLLTQYSELLSKHPQFKHLRDMLYVKLLAEQGHADAALSLLEHDDSLEALILKINLLWTLSRWQETSQHIVKLLQTQTLSADDRADYVLRLAVTHAMLNNKQALIILKQTFADFMTTTKHKDVFMLITSPLETASKTIYQNSLDQLTAANTFTSFLKDWRAKNLN